jgi:cytochrome P450/NADPH-cytochrome P450 reductase
MLFFGCRHRRQDFLYEAELKLYQAQGVTELYCAFSREEGAPRVYVQDRLLEHADEVWELLGRGAVIYVCGDAASMAPGVRAAFLELHQRKTGQGVAQAEAWMAELVEKKAYVADVWGSG